MPNKYQSTFEAPLAMFMMVGTLLLYVHELFDEEFAVPTSIQQPESLFQYLQDRHVRCGCINARIEISVDGDLPLLQNVKLSRRILGAKGLHPPGERTYRAPPRHQPPDRAGRSLSCAHPAVGKQAQLSTSASPALLPELYWL